MNLAAGLTLPLILALLFAALLHAGWNALIKSGGDQSLDTALIHSLGVLFAIPAACWFGLPVAGVVTLRFGYAHAQALVRASVIRPMAPGWRGRNTGA